MSIKGSSKKLKIEYVLPIFAIFTLLATALRTYQCITMIEPETGFYRVENISILYLYVMLAVAGVLIFAISYLAKKVPQSVMPEGKNIPLAIGSLVFAATLILYPVFNLASAFSGNDALFMQIGVRAATLTEYLLKSGVAASLLEALFAIISAVYFIIVSAKYFGAKLNIANRKILAVFPVFWATMRMVQRFTRTISFIFVSDLLLKLFAIAFMMMFFLSFAQLASKVNSRHVMNKIYAYALIGAMFSCLVTVPKMIAFAFDSSLVVKSELTEICDLGFAVFAVVLCVVLLKMPRDDNITLKDVEKLRKERTIEEENEE